jgi:hypothetical protein
MAVDILSMLSGLIGSIKVDELVESGILKDLVAKAQPETIRSICITILASGSQDPAVRRAAIEAIAGIDMPGTPIA